MVIKLILMLYSSIKYERKEKFEDAKEDKII